MEPWPLTAADIPPERKGSEKCVKATCVLHNFMRCSEGREPPAVRGAGHTGEEPLPGLGRDAANNSSREAVQVRDVFMAHFSAKGAVAWQPTEKSYS